jgi:monoamine oxidase
MKYRDVDVCVVGTGFAGLAAARYLLDSGNSESLPPSVVVLEARDRVGGRVWNRPASDGTIVSAGGTWIGKNQERMFDLVEQVGLCAYPQYYGKPTGDPLWPFNGKCILRLGSVLIKGIPL